MSYRESVARVLSSFARVSAPGRQVFSIVDAIVVEGRGAKEGLESIQQVWLLLTVDAAGKGVERDGGFHPRVPSRL